MLVLGEQTDTETFEGLYEFSLNGSYFMYPKIEKIDTHIDGYVHGGDKKSCVVILSDRYYHTFMQSLGIILQEFTKDKNLHFYIILGAPGNILFDTHILFFMKTLRVNKIKHTLVDLGYYKINNQRFFIKNFDYYPYPQLTDNFITNLYNVSKPYHFAGEPFRKVYCSRRKTKYKTGIAIVGDKDPETLPIKDDSKRVSNEEELENYLISKGFEVVYPEDFVSFEDQINYFSSVKTLISITSAGLTNMCFMKDGSQVIEIKVPMLVQGTLSLHGHYVSIAWAKKLIYFAIPSMRSTEDVVSAIETNQTLLSLVSEGLNE